MSHSMTHVRIQRTQAAYITLKWRRKYINRYYVQLRYSPSALYSEGGIVMWPAQREIPMYEAGIHTMS